MSNESGSRSAAVEVRTNARPRGSCAQASRNRLRRSVAGFVAIATSALLSACGGDGGGGANPPGGGSPAPTTYAVGVTVNGLSGTGLKLQDNGVDTLPVGASGTFAFNGRLAAGAAYAVTVLAQPGGQTCTVANGSGTIAAADVSGIVVACTDVPAPLAVTAITPVDEAASAPRAAVVSATFNRAVSPASATASSVVVTGPQGLAMAGSVAASGVSVQWTPAAAALPGATTYAVTLAASIQDASGSALGQPFVSHFTTAPQAWAGTTTSLAALSSNTSGLRPIAMLAAPDGDMTVLWFHDQANTAIDMARMSASTGTWSAAATIYSASGGNGLFNMNAAIDGQGVITLVWQESNVGTVGTVAYLARIAADTGGLSTPESLPAVPAGVQAQRISMAMDAAGDMTVGSTDGAAVYLVRRAAQASSWSAPATIAVPNGADNLEVTMDSHANAVAAWVGRPPTTMGTLNASSFDVASGTWSAPTQVGTSVLTGLFNEFSMVTDATGATTIAWSDSPGLAGTDSIAVVRRDPSTGQWGAQVRVDQAASGYAADSPGLAVDATGVVTVAWNEFDAVKAARFDPAAAAWSTPVTIATGNSTVAPTLLADVAGNVSALFMLDNRLQSAQYLVTGGAWQAAVAIDASSTSTTVFAGQPVAAVDPSGTVAAAWYDEDSSSRSYTVANVFR